MPTRYQVQRLSGSAEYTANAVEVKSIGNDEDIVCSIGKAYSVAGNAAGESNDLTEQKDDGDCLYGSWLKEMDEIPQYMSIHPMMTMLAGSEPGISGMVAITDQTTIALNEWLNDPDQFKTQEGE